MHTTDRQAAPRRRVIDTTVPLAAMRAAWTRRGEELFGGDAIPSRRAVYDAAVSVVLEGLVVAGASITEISEICSTSRRAVRDTLRRLGLYRGRPTLSATQAAAVLGLEVGRG